MALSSFKRAASLLPAAILSCFPAAALAHGGEVHEGQSIWSMWQFSPEIVLGLVIAGAAYVAGVRRGVSAKPWRHIAFFGGLVALALALLSPVEPLADHVFAIHQVEHMLLRTIGPMLILVSMPQAALMRGLPDPVRRGFVGPIVANAGVRSVFGFLSRPLVATLLFLGATYFWMWPRFHDIAILDEPIHYLWHVSLLVSGLFFFSVIFDPRSTPQGPSLGTRLAMFWFAAMGNILLGAYLSFKTVPLYSAYDVMGRFFDIGALSDEQIGGLTMWIPGCMMFAIAALFVLYRWGAEETRNEERRVRTGRAAAHEAERQAGAARANTALAMGLGGFAIAVALIAVAASIAYDHGLMAGAGGPVRQAEAPGSVGHG